ncbi:MAG: glycoside hydrolase domain-containing protein, partial [Planctomycetota bacterium]
MAPVSAPSSDQSWDRDELGNHRAVVSVEAAADAVVVEIPWRRRDAEPEKKSVVVVDAKTGNRIGNVRPLRVGRESGTIAFQPESGPGEYRVYYLPYEGTIQCPYPKPTYLTPVATADAEWSERNGLGDGAVPEATDRLPRARFVELQAVDESHTFGPMEVIATRAETESLIADHPDAAFLVFPEARSHPVRMSRDLPKRWVEIGPRDVFDATVSRGEFLTFQIAAFAARTDLRRVRCESGDLVGQRGRIPASEFRCFNTGG